MSAVLQSTAQRKYEFVDGDTVTTWDGRTLRRIRALVAIAATLWTPAVAPGDLGGYIESESNLDAQVSGNAWVYGNAWVSGDARVYGNAWVSGKAWVSGNAQVSGNAWVYGNAWVSGKAWVSGNAQVSGNAWVYGNAWVSGDAQVYGNAWVSGDAQVSGDARVSGNARVYGDGLIVWFTGVGSENGTLTVYNAKNNTLHVTRGCFAGTPEEFLAASARRHDARIKREYELLIEVARSRIEAARESVRAPEEVEE